MKNIFSRIIPLSLIAALVTAILPVSVFAAQVTGISVSPSSIVNNVNNPITVTGTGFDNTSAIQLDGSNLATNFVDAQTLTATIASGISVGPHTISVSNASGSATLTVTAPPPPPPTATATRTPPPTATVTRTPLPFVRPQFVMRASKPSGSFKTGGHLNINLVLENAGTAPAYSAQAVFSSADLVPTKNGGVAALGTVDADDEVSASQGFIVSSSLEGKSVLVVDLTVTYYDGSGSTYSDKFTLSIPVKGTTTGGSGYAGPTATPTGMKSSQLVITSYSASIDPLQPGMQFALKMTVQNVGNANAQRVTMIVGGGSGGSSGSGTPQPGGVSGGSGEFTNFAPVGASNVQSLGDLAAGASTQAGQNLIVNVSTNPGAYPMKVTFSYLNDRNEVINDEQVITLLVYSLPTVDVSFYRPPDPFFVGQPGALPIQVVNLGKRLSVLGTIKVASEGGTVDNGTSLVGSLDAGGYFTIDSMLTPETSGKVTLTVTIEYVDDFNQSRTIEKTLEVEVAEGVTETPTDPSMNGGNGGGGEFMPADQETTLHKIFRFIKGLLGLDSSWPVWQSPGGGSQPSEQPAPAQPATGKG